MQTEATVGVRARIGRRWRAASVRFRILLLMLSASLACGAVFVGCRWWTSWPYRHLLKNPDGHYPVAFSPDGSTLATTSGATGIIELWDVSSGRKRVSWANPGGRKRFFGTFSRDGSTFACPTYLEAARPTFSIELIEVASGRNRATIDSPRPDSLGHYFLEDGRTLRLLAIDRAGRDVVDIDFKTGRVISTRGLSCPMTPGLAAVSEDGRRMAYLIPTSRVMTAMIWDIDLDREDLQLPAFHGAKMARAVTFSPDRKALAVGRDDGSIELWDLATRAVRSTLRGHGRGYVPWRIRFSPDGSTLTSEGHFEGNFVSVDFLRIQMARAVGDRDHQAQFELIVLDTATGRRLVQSKWDGVATFSPDGRTLATGHDDWNVRLRDMSSLR
jgi:WD40 repeat protein